MFNLLPSAPRMAHLIRADYQEEQGNLLLAAVIRQRIESIDNNDDGNGRGGSNVDGYADGDGYAYAYGDGTGDSDRDGAGNGHGDGDGHGYGDGTGHGYGGGDLDYDGHDYTCYSFDDEGSWRASCNCR